jgi:hypothetical protein
VIDPCTRPLQKTQGAGHPKPFRHLLRSGSPAGRETLSSRNCSRKRLRVGHPFVLCDLDSCLNRMGHTARDAQLGLGQQSLTDEDPSALETWLCFLQLPRIGEASRAESRGCELNHPALHEFLDHTRSSQSQLLHGLTTERPRLVAADAVKCCHPLYRRYRSR